ncbi:LRRC15 [Branchiostoma lanceolatum]|uniref:LRRC15 protein n=1 Tax=Branchiostoma lanceolatum TaxID=7740 RepID=A0A8J9Z7K2_BRALA|nr:LRRC15 [Branchiostoma lanceolatum]
MRKSRAATVCVLGLLWVVTAAFVCPEKCNCVLRKVDCVGRELKRVPDDIPLRTRYLYFRLTSIQSLADAVFSNLTSLRGLFLRNNRIPILPGRIFSHLTRLFYLYLTNNHISGLPAGLFSQLTSLNELYLSNNDIVDLPYGIFSNLTNLRWLEVDNNSISSLSAGVFSRLNKLEMLILSNNSIKHLPGGLFSHVRSLQHLWLSDNGITDLTAGLFSHLINLKTLHLSNNNIKHISVGVFSHLHSLQQLFLSNNGITDIHGGVFSRLANLEDLYLNDNDIRDLPAEVFSNLSSLNQLSLDNNNISSLSKGMFSNLTSLTQLNLTNNEIVELPGKVFFHLANLTSLFLSDNSISRLPIEVFSHLSNLERLHLSNNNMEDPPNGVFSNLTSLIFLSLSNNDISHLHAALFAHLTHLISLDLQGNRISDLPEGVFSRLSSLRGLTLANNDIEDLPGDVWANQTSLKLLDLSNNKISHLSAGIFSHLNSLEELVLGNNDIQELPDEVFSHLPRLAVLHLGHNSIRYLTHGVFTTLTSLKELDMSNNDLESLPATIFSHLTSLVKLNLTRNSLQTLPADMSRLPRQTVLDIDGNPWRCDCRLQGLMSSPRLRALLHEGLTCSSPPHMEGVALAFVVADTVCYRHGDCSAGSTDSTCVCIVGWTGPYCNKEVNVALRKTATQISSYPYQGPEMAVDGYRGTNAGTPENECAITRNELQPWWKVDLGDIYTVSRVSVLNRGDWQEERLRNFMVRVGPNENFTLNDQCGQTYTATPTKAQTIAVLCDPPMSGRYVSVQIMGRWEFLTLCEVEVYITEICCAEPMIENGDVEGSSCFPHTVNVTCKPGYRLVGAESLGCTATGRWNNELPICEKVCCDDTVGITNGRVAANDGFCSGSVVMFSCDPGFELVGTLWATCREDGGYDGEMPTCQLVCSTWWSGQNCKNLSASAIGGISAAAAVVVVGLIAIAVVVRMKMRGTWPRYTIVHRQRTFRAPGELRLYAPPRPQFTCFEVDPARLEICEKIGRGAFGVVSRALLHLDTETTKEVAVKTFSASADEDDKLSFLQEIRAVVDLGSHENLLGLIGCCTLVGDLMYLITEFMPHGDLKSFLGKCRDTQKMTYIQLEGYYKSGNRIYCFEEKEMYKVSLQVAKGMDHIAKAGYIHGDLAARNVLVGDDLQVKISDFGLADQIYSRGYRRQDRVRKIPWKWMAPERLTDGERYTSQSDVWSFGVVLYEIVTLGGSPYPDMPTSDLPDRLRSGYRMPQPGDCPQPMYDLMLQCWRLEPEDRPFFHKLVTALEKLFTGQVDLIERETNL